MKKVSVRNRRRLLDDFLKVDEADGARTTLPRA